MWFLLERFSLPLGAWDGLRYFIVPLPEPSVYIYDDIRYSDEKKGQIGKKEFMYALYRESNGKFNVKLNLFQIAHLFWNTLTQNLVSCTF